MGGCKWVEGRLNVALLERKPFEIGFPVGSSATFYNHSKSTWRLCAYIQE